MGRARKEKGARRRKKVDDPRRSKAVIPFLLVFGVTWVLFGGYALWFGVSTSDRSTALVGGVAAGLGGLLLARAAWLHGAARGNP